MQPYSVGLGLDSVPSDSEPFTWKVIHDIHGTFEGTSVGDIVRTTFYNYCTVCTVGEAGQSQMDGEARKATAIAIKAVARSFIVDPKAIDGQYNANCCAQCFKYPRWTSSDVAREYPGVKSDYDSVKHAWMYNSKQKSFIATQVSGNWNRPGQKEGGVLSHRGSKYLLNHGIAGNCFEILNYYYVYSDKSTGSLLFFDSNGNRISILTDR